jgi:hypothetical protein
MEVAGRTRAQHRQRLIYVLGLLIAGNHAARAVCFLHEVVAVIGVDARGAGRRLVDAPPKRIVFEADRAAAAGQRDAHETVLEVPGIARGVRAGGAGEHVSVVIVGVFSSSPSHARGAILARCPSPTISLRSASER